MAEGRTGMIDSATEGADRGYDFIKAVRWFAERADFVLVFFDPEKVRSTSSLFFKCCTHSEARKIA